MSTVQANQFTDSSGGVLAPISSVMRNRIINGAMTISQRNGTSSITPTADDTFSLDRWAAGINVASKFSIQQNAGSVTPPVGFTNYLGVTSLSSYSVAAGDVMVLKQTIEGFNIADLGWGTANAATVTLSFWVRSSLTGTFGGTFMNSAQNRAYPFTYTISSANTWEQKSITIAGDTTGTWVTNNGAGIKLGFQLGVGSTFTGTAGAWAASNLWGATGSVSVVGTNGATFYITGVQLERGTQATSFEYRQYGEELLLCQRYAASTFPIGTAWGQNRGAAGCVIAGGTGNTGYGVQLPWRFPVRMRATPSTITTYNPVAANADVRNFALTADRTISTLGFAQNSMDAICFTSTTTGSDAGGMAYGIHYSVSAEL
jgi:hypothetical protein